jgi:hypothetical protein
MSRKNPRSPGTPSGQRRNLTTPKKLEKIKIKKTKKSLKKKTQKGSHFKDRTVVICCLPGVWRA